MSGKNITIKAALPEQLTEILGLLTEVGLPHEGVPEHLSGFIAAASEDSEVVGCAGIENHGQFALLRSVAVSDRLQRSGLGSQLVESILAKARAQGIQEILLLTTTAADFFAKRFGFTEALRSDYDAHFSGSTEWHLPRCSSAVLMKLDLE